MNKDALQEIMSQNHLQGNTAAMALLLILEKNNLNADLVKHNYVDKMAVTKREKKNFG